MTTSTKPQKTTKCPCGSDKSPFLYEGDYVCDDCIPLLAEED